MEKMSMTSLFAQHTRSTQLFTHCGGELKVVKFHKWKIGAFHPHQWSQSKCCIVKYLGRPQINVDDDLSETTNNRLDLNKSSLQLSLLVDWPFILIL